MSEDRLFTLEEANAMLPDLRATLEAMQEARRVVLASAEHVQIPQEIMAMLTAMATQGHDAAVATAHA